MLSFASLGATAHGFFQGIPLSMLQRDGSPAFKGPSLSLCSFILS